MLQSGDEVYTGLKLWINASRKTKALDRDKTTINGKSIKDIGSDIAGFTVDGLIYYTIPHTDTKVHIDFIFRDAEPVNIEWKSKNSDGVVKRWLDYVEDGPPNYDDNTSGSFAEDSVLYFSGLPNHGKIIKKWYINGKEQNTAHRFIAYKVLKNDIVGGKILIEAEFGDKETDIPVYWKSLDETKGAVYARGKVNGKWTDLTSGHKFEEGYFFYVNARPKPGFIADKWYINGEEVPGTGINQLRYTVASKDIKNGKIEISVSFKEAPKIKVEWFIDEPDKGSIRAEQVINGKWTEVQSGSLFDQSSKICIVVEPKEGYAPDTWYINGKEADTETKGEPEFWYTVKIEDIANGSIKISHKFKDAEKIQMDFIKEGNGRISVHNPKTNALITDTQIYEGTQLRIKASPFLGSKFKHFELNGKKINSSHWGNGVYATDYTVKEKDKDKNSGKISINAVFENDPDAPSQGTIPVEFYVESGHEDKGSIIALFNDKKEFASGYKFKEGDGISFYALPKDGYQAKWFVNGTEYHTGNNCYIELDSQNISGGKLSVKAQFVSANPVRLNFSSEGNGNIRAEKLMGGDWITVNSGDTVYEGTDISFEIEGAEGNMADWFINNSEAVNEIGWAGSLGFNITDHNAGGVCTVEASFRKAETYPVSFKIAEGGEGKGSLSIKYWDIVTRTTVTTSEQNISIKEGSSSLRFMVSLNEGAQVEKWTINGEAQQHNPKTFWFGALHKSKLGGQNKLEVVVHLK
ncbi:MULTISPECIES: hypothetical protein [unclassified Treponema]|uniref:hypothetical protein n=1 Tax=unclassified Treponema TaxID=2638727 RepID=UPI0020A36C9D|nr:MULTISPECIES: hypothetical protein [unclassified Treponema]